MEELGKCVVGVGSSGNTGVGIGVRDGVGVFVGSGVFVGDDGEVAEGVSVGTAVTVSITTGVAVEVEVGMISGVGAISRVKTTRVANTDSGSATGVGVQPMKNMPKLKSKMQRIIVITS